jgi:hypothetical protein
MKKKRDIIKNIPGVIGFLANFSRTKYYFGIETWPTKSYEIWIFLQVLMHKIRPASLVEFGSGRSTNYLAEYAFKNNAKFVSIEENKNYAKKIKKGLTNTMLPDKFVYHVNIFEDWFDINKLCKIIDFAPEFLLIDAPGGAFSRGLRNSESGVRYMKELVKNAKIVVVDDTHRRSVFEASEEMTEGNLRRISMRYSVNNLENYITFYYSDKYHRVVSDLQSFLGIDPVIVEM